MKEIDEPKTIKPEFKPGDTPYLQFGNEILNNNIPWSAVLGEVLITSGMTLTEIATKLEVSMETLNNVVNGNDCPLNFKQGARLLGLQELG